MFILAFPLFLYLPLFGVQINVARQGIEPRYWASKAHVLPLDDLAIIYCAYILGIFGGFSKETP